MRHVLTFWSRKAAAEEAYVRWRAGESSTKQKKFKPHRLAVIEDEGTLKEVDVKKLTVCPVQLHSFCSHSVQVTPIMSNADAAA